MVEESDLQHYKPKRLWRCSPCFSGCLPDSDDEDERARFFPTFNKAFNVSRSEHANLAWLGIRTDSKTLPDKTFQKLMNSISPTGLGTGLKFDWGAEQETLADFNPVRWSIFDLFENDLGPNEPRPLVIHAASLIAQIASTLLSCICFWSTWYSTLIVTYWGVLENDVKWGRDTWLFDVLYALDTFFDVIFFILTLLSQRTTVLDLLTCMETLRPATLALRELKSKGFWIDLLTCFPWTHFVIRRDAPNWLLLLKTLRIRHLARRKRASVVLEKDILMIARLLLYVMLGGHVLSCFYFIMTYETKAFRRHPYFQFTEAPYGFFDFYTFSLRAATYLILGADLEGYSDMENTVIFFCTLLGVMVNALVFSQIIVVISRRSTLETQMVEESNNTREAMHTLSLPSTLQLRILAHYTYERVHKGHGTVVKLLGGLSEQLNFELHLARHYRLVTAVPFFKRSHPYVLREIVLVLSDVIFLPGDWICRLGDEGKEMYFLHKGCCSVLSDQLACLRQVKQGDYFGEISLLTGVQRTAFVRADTFSMVAELSKDKFDQIMRRFPQELQVIVTGFSEEQKTLLLNIRQQLRAARSSVQTLDSGAISRPAARTQREEPGLSPVVDAALSQSRAASKVSAPPARRTSLSSRLISETGNNIQERGEQDGYKGHTAPKPQRRDSDTDSDFGDTDTKPVFGHRTSSASMTSRFSKMSTASHKSTTSHRSIVDKAKHAVASFLPMLPTLRASQCSTASDDSDNHLSVPDNTPTAGSWRPSTSSNDPHEPEDGSQALAGPKQAPLKGLGFMRSMVSKLAKQRAASKLSAAPAAEQPGAAQPGTEDIPASPSSGTASAEVRREPWSQGSDVFPALAELPRVDSNQSLASGIDPVSVATSDASASSIPQLKRRPSLLGWAWEGSPNPAVQRNPARSQTDPPEPSGSPQGASKIGQPKLQRRGTLSNLFGSIVGGVAGLAGSVEGAQDLLRRKSLAHSSTGEKLGVASSTNSGLPEPEPDTSRRASSDPTGPKMAPLVQADLRDLEPVGKVVEEAISLTAQELHENSDKADQLTTDVQSCHQMVYGECARMEELWLMKRAEIRQERRDIAATLEQLTAQVNEAQEDLHRIVSDDSVDDVTLQAFNIVELDAGEARAARFGSKGSLGRSGSKQSIGKVKRSKTQGWASEAS